METQVPPRTRQVVKAFLFDRAMEFINQKQAVPCSRASRRKAAREIAKRYMIRIGAERLANLGPGEEIPNANV